MESKSKFLTSQENSFHLYLLNKFKMRSLNGWTSVQALRGMAEGLLWNIFGRGVTMSLALYLRHTANTKKHC